MSGKTDAAGAGASRVLVVDDNEMTAQALARLLSQSGYQPSIALRGAQAIDMARADGCAAAFVDIHLPDLNGLVVSQKLRELLGPDVPVVILSGDTSMEVINALPHVGATYFFSKPVNAPHLIERLREWLGEKAPPA